MLDVFFQIGLLVVVAKLLEGVLGRFGLSSIVAYALTGVLLGPVAGIVEPTGELRVFLDIGIFLLFFLVGIDEIDVGGFVTTIRGRYFAAALVSVIVSIGVSLLVTADLLPFDFVIGLELRDALALSGILALSSLGLLAKVLADGGHLKEPIGLRMFTIVIIAEVIALLVVGFTIGESLPELTPTAVVTLLLQITGFVVLAWILSTKLLPPIISFLRRILNVPELSFGLLIGCLFLVVYAAEEYGLHGTMGALLFGTALSGLPRQIRADIMPGLRSVSEGLFIPLFFASAGLHFDLSFLNLPLTTIIVVVTVPAAGKFLAAVLGTHLLGIETPMAMATGLMAKGVAEIALLVILFDHHVLDRDIFSLLLLLMLGYILLMPTAIGLVVRRVTERGSTEVPASVPPSFARYALEGLTVRNVADTTRSYPMSTTSLQSLVENWTVLNQHDYVIVDEGKLAGMVSTTRMRFVSKKLWDSTTASEIMRQNPPCTNPDEQLDAAVARMTQHSMSVIGVIDPDSDEFLGTVSSQDILDLLTLMDEINDELRSSGQGTDPDQ